jgi:hypothetical protein
MKNVQAPFQGAIHTLLDGQITTYGIDVAIYDKMDIPSDADYPHIVINDWTINEENDKDAFNSNATLSFNIYDRFQTNKGSRARIYDIKDQMLQILFPNSPGNEPISANGFNFVWGKVDNSMSLPKEQTDTHVTIGELLRIRMWIEQLT